MEKKSIYHIRNLYEKTHTSLLRGISQKFLHPDRYPSWTVEQSVILLLIIHKVSDEEIERMSVEEGLTYYFLLCK